MEKEKLLLEATGLGGYMSLCRRKLHSIAEVGFETEKSISFIRTELERIGVEARPCGRAGLTALIGSGQDKCFLLRADIDALPVEDEPGRGFHGCGHDMHAAMLLGTARLLKKHEKELRRPVKLMFQSAEELLAGAKDMLEAGVLRNPEVAGAAMFHVMTGVPLPAGSVVVPEAGISAPAADFFTIEVRGKGCHGSSPNEGVDPIAAAAHIICALEQLPARELAMNEAAVLTIGSVHGGSAANAIPEAVKMTGSLRAMEEKIREYIKSRLGEIASGVAGALGAQTLVSFDRGCPGLYNHPEMRELAFLRAREAIGHERVFSAAELGKGAAAGSEDFAYISREVPSVMLALAAGEPEKGFKYPLHHRLADFDETAMPYGAAVLAACALGWENFSQD